MRKLIEAKGILEVIPNSAIKVRLLIANLCVWERISKDY